MKKRTLAISACCAVLGSAAILLSGIRHGEGIEGWKPLNENLANALEEKRKPEPGNGRGQGLAKDGKTDPKTVGAENTANSAVTQQPKQINQSEPQARQTADTVTEQQSGIASSKKGTADAPGQPEPNTGDSSVNAVPNKAADLQASAAGGTSGKKININAAQAAELMTIPGIGAKKAQAIIDYRNERGPFKRIADLDKVKGIGPKMLEKIKPYIEL